MTKEEKDAKKKSILFVPCKDKERLHKWIKTFLDLDIPDCIVDPASTSSPMDMIWEIYQRATLNDDPDFNRVLYYACRDGFKTLGAAILEVLSVVHLGRDVAHMAAIEAQANKAQSYVKKFFSKPFLRDFVVGDNTRATLFVRYQHQETKENINEKTFKDLSPDLQNNYDEIKNFVRIIICTMQGANGEHVPMFVVDEVDVVKDAKAYEEAKMIPAPINGKMPITLLASTRKFSFGKVQKEIDEAAKSGLKIRHWNLIDCTEACPPERHLPDEPKIQIYASDENLKAISEKDHKELTEDERIKYKPEEGYQGCLQNCKLFAVCKGRLATDQKSKSPLLKPIAHTISQFKAVTLPTAKAQLLCRKPSTEGLIYPNFDRDIHMLTAAQMAEKITGIPHDKNLTKAQLIQIVQQWALLFSSGMDFGYSHNFAVVTGFEDGFRAFILDVISMPELEPSQQIQICKKRIKNLQPGIWPDTENPQMIKVFRKAGFKMKEWKKTPGSVLGGIDAVRMKLSPAMGDPTLFLLKDDEGCEQLAKDFSSYHWKLSTDGRISDIPDDEDDDRLDALRYWIMNRFAVKGKVQISDKTPSQMAAESTDLTVDNWARREIDRHVGEGGQEVGGKGSSGRFKWEI